MADDVPAKLPTRLMPGSVEWQFSEGCGVFKREIE